MEEKIKLYSQRAISIATYLGGPIAAGILIRRNFLNLGKEKEGLISLIIGIVSTVLLLWGIFQIPEEIIDKIPNALIPAIYTGIIYFIVEKMQGDILKKHKEEKNKFYSNWRATGIGVVIGIIMLGGIFAYSYYAPSDLDAYIVGLKEFDKNEAEALRLFEMTDNSSNSSIVYFIEQIGIPKWKENIEILNNLNEIYNIDNIPEKFYKKIDLLFEYSNLRIETYEMLSKAFQIEASENDEEFIEKYIQLNARINELIDELSK